MRDKQIGALTDKEHNFVRTIAQYITEDTGIKVTSRDLNKTRRRLVRVYRESNDSSVATSIYNDAIALAREYKVPVVCIAKGLLTCELTSSNEGWYINRYVAKCDYDIEPSEAFTATYKRLTAKVETIRNESDARTITRKAIKQLIFDELT